MIDPVLLTLPRGIASKFDLTAQEILVLGRLLNLSLIRREDTQQPRNYAITAREKLAEDLGISVGALNSTRNNLIKKGLLIKLRHGATNGASGWVYAWVPAVDFEDAKAGLVHLGAGEDGPERLEHAKKLQKAAQEQTQKRRGVRAECMKKFRSPGRSPAVTDAQQTEEQAEAGEQEQASEVAPKTAPAAQGAPEAAPEARPDSYVPKLKYKDLSNAQWDEICYMCYPGEDPKVVRERKLREEREQEEQEQKEAQARAVKDGANERA